MPAPGPYPFDLSAFWSEVASTIGTVRASIGLPPLNGPDGASTGSIGVGQEFLPAELAPPSIVVVPKGFDYRPVRHPGSANDANALAYVEYARWFRFECHLWGDEVSDYTTSPSSTVGAGWNTTIELERELVTALVAFQAGSGGTRIGIPAVRLDSARFEQPEDVTRVGRYLVLDVSVETPLADLPWVALPYATSTTSGVVVDATIDFVPAGGGSTVTVGIVVSPTSTQP